MNRLIPGTTMKFSEQARESAFSLISPVLEATGGLTLSQLSKLTGLEGTTIQNWIKRGWVTPSVNKKYGERSVVRILLINIMRGTLKLDDITKLMMIVNGDVIRMDDDILHDTELYNLLCTVIYEAENGRLWSGDEIRERVNAHLPDEGLTKRERNVLENVVLIMVQSAISGYFRQLAEGEFGELEFYADEVGIAGHVTED